MKHWTKQEDELLIAKRKDKSYEELAKELERSKPSIARRISKLKLGNTTGYKYLSEAKVDVSKLSEADKGYIAGYIDADGSIGVYKQRKIGYNLYFPQVSVTGMNASIIGWFGKIFAVNIVKGKARWSNNEPVYMAQLHRLVDVKTLLEAIIPYLKLKKTEANIATKMCEIKLAYPRKGQYCPEIQQLYDEIMSMKHSRKHGNNAYKIS